MASPIRVVIVDDSAFMRTTLSKMLRLQDDIEVVATGRTGIEAVALAEQHQPDLITLDIEMPQMDGLSALPRIKRVCRSAVLMVSSLTVEGSTAALTALRLGAEDFLAKDMSQVSLGIGAIEADLLAKVRALGRSTTRRLHEAARVRTAPAADFQLNLGRYDVLVIGSSTGGPPALETLICGLPAEFPLPVLIAQHMPELFTRSMSQRLDDISHLKVVHAEVGMAVQPGMVYIAPGGRHLRIRQLLGAQRRIEVSDEPADALYKPSVNELFASAARSCGSRTLGIMLTGMGEDGLVGGRAVHAAGGTLLAQDAGSCVVYGMPKAVTQAGLVAVNLCPQGLGRLLSESTTRKTAAPLPRKTG